MGICDPQQFLTVLVKIIFLILLLIIMFVYYIDDYFIDEAAEVKPVKKKPPIKKQTRGEICDVKQFLEPAVTEPEPSTGIMDLYDPPPFNMDYDDYLINEVNNVDITYNTNLDDLFTKIGQRYDFLLDKGKAAFPPGYAMTLNDPPSVDISYNDTVINKINNVTLLFDTYVQKILRAQQKECEESTPIVGVSYSKAQMDLNNPPPFDMAQAELLINKVNNTDEIEDIDVNIIFTMPFIRKHFQFVHFVSGIFGRIDPPSCRCYPPGYAMSPYDPPPFNIGTGQVLFNEVNNRDVREDIDLYELLGIRPKKFFRTFRTLKGKCNKKESPSDEQ